MWNEKYETMPREELHALQLIRLKKVVRLSYDNNIHYRNKMDAAGINPEDIRSLDDLTNLTFMTKDDFRATYP